MKYLIHYVRNENSLNLSKLTISFSTVKLKLGPEFSQFIHRLKYSYDYDSNMEFLSVGIMLYFQFSQIHKEILGFLNVALAGLLDFPNLSKRRLYFQIVTKLGNWNF